MCGRKSLLLPICFVGPLDFTNIFNSQDLESQGHVCLAEGFTYWDVFQHVQLHLEMELERICSSNVIVAYWKRP